MPTNASNSRVRVRDRLGSGQGLYEGCVRVRVRERVHFRVRVNVKLG